MKLAKQMSAKYVRFGKPSPIMKSRTVCLLPIAGCLREAEKVTGVRHGNWQTQSRKQDYFLFYCYREMREYVDRLSEVESMASRSMDEINRFLSERGFTISLGKIIPPNFGVASVFKLLLEWENPGKVVTIEADGKHPAVRMDESVDFWVSRSWGRPIVSINAKNGDKVFMTICDSPKEDDFEQEKVIALIDSSLSRNHDYNGVVFPMIDYDQCVDISWIEGMHVQGQDGPWVISEALQQTKFRMNELGARVESAVIMNMALGWCPGGKVRPDLVIDRPFLLWVKRKDLPFPLFIAYFNRDVWRKPDKL